MKNKLLKMEKDSCRNIQEDLKLAMKKVRFISFIIFILKTTSMHFDLTYYYTKDFLLFSLITHSK